MRKGKFGVQQILLDMERLAQDIHNNFNYGKQYDKALVLSEYLQETIGAEPILKSTGICIAKFVKSEMNVFTWLMRNFQTYAITLNTNKHEDLRDRMTTLVFPVTVLGTMGLYRPWMFLSLSEQTITTAIWKLVTQLPVALKMTEKFAEEATLDNLQ